MRSSALALLWLCHAPLAGQDPAAALAALANTPALAGARIGVVVKDLASGELVCRRDADHGFMTASNMKLVTIAAALLTLGPDHRFETRAVATARPHHGTLDGDLVLVGSGDPTLGGRQEDHPAAVFERMAEQMRREHGLTAITGSVLGDDDCQPDEVMGEGWAWNYQTDAYAAQVSGLCFAENVVTATLRAAEPDAIAALTLSPPTAYVAVAATAVGHDADSDVWTARDRGGNRVRIGGRVRIGERPYTTRFTVDNPTAYAATVLHETLVARGIAVAGPPGDLDRRGPRPERYGDELVVATHRSAPLGEILVTLGKVSQNLYAEQVIRAAARHATGSGAMRDAAAHAKAVLASLGVDVTGMRVADGSGLSRLDLVRPAQLAGLLEGMWRHELRDAYLATLPIAGVDGTLRGRFADTPAAGRVRAKTGYISGVVALSGYVLRERRPPLVFAVLVNNFTCPTQAVKDAVDAFVVALVRHAGE